MSSLIRNKSQCTKVSFREGFKMLSRLIIFTQTLLQIGSSYSESSVTSVPDFHLETSKRIGGVWWPRLCRAWGSNDSHTQHKKSGIFGLRMTFQKAPKMRLQVSFIWPSLNFWMHMSNCITCCLLGLVNFVVVSPPLLLAFFFFSINCLRCRNYRCALLLKCPPFMI